MLEKEVEREIEKKRERKKMFATITLCAPMHWPFDFNDMSTHLGLFLAQRLGYCILCTCIFKFLCSFLSFLHIWYPLFLSTPTNLQIYLFDTDGTLSVTTTLGQSAMKMYPHPISKTRTLSPNTSYYPSQDTSFGGLNPLHRIQSAYSQFHRQGNCGSNRN